MTEYFPTETTEEETTTTEEAKTTPMPTRRPFAIWKVGNTEYKLRLTTEAIAELEGRYKTNLLNLTSTEDSLPAMSIMLDVAFAALKRYNHGISKKDMYVLFDRYVDEGGSQLTFYTDVFMDIFAVSGFFTTATAERVRAEMEEIRDKI